MTFLKNTFKQIVFSVLSILGGVALGATLVGAATTISTSVTTGGTLSVTGLSSLGQASSTMLSANTAYFGATATSTFSSAGALTLLGGFTGTTGSFSSTLAVSGDTTLASTTATGFKVGQVGTRHTGIVSGSCTIANVAIAATSTAMATCSSATGIVSGDLVFVQAINTLPDNFIVQAASTTEDAVIQIDIFNIPTTTADSDTDDTGARSFRFWGVR